MLTQDAFIGSAEKIAEKLSNTVPDVLAISIIGSIARRFTVAPGDIDLLVITQSPPQIRHLTKGLENVNSSELDRFRWKRQEDILTTQFMGLKVSASFWTKQLLATKLESVISGHHPKPIYKTWAVSGVVPEVLCADIIDSYIILEEQDCISHWKENLRTYPTKLKRSILTICYEELLTKISIASRSLNSGDHLTMECALYSSFLPLLRGFFALDNQYFRGMKNIKHQLESYLPNKIETLNSLTNKSLLSNHQKIEILRISANEIMHGL